MNREDANTARDPTERDIEDVAAARVDNAIEAHRRLGPRVLESVDQPCLETELERAGLEARCEVPLRIRYGEVRKEAGFRLDMLVDDMVIITEKAVDRLLPIHAAQRLTYLKPGGRRLGFLLNWNVKLMKNGIRRVVYEIRFADFAPLRFNTPARKVSAHRARGSLARHTVTPF